MEPKVWPRHFSISSDGRSLYLVEQFLNKLQVWNISEADGTLNLKMESASENSPSYVCEIENK